MISRVRLRRPASSSAIAQRATSSSVFVSLTMSTSRRSDIMSSPHSEPLRLLSISGITSSTLSPPPRSHTMSNVSFSIVPIDGGAQFPVGYCEADDAGVGSTTGVSSHFCEWNTTLCRALARVNSPPHHSPLV